MKLQILFSLAIMLSITSCSCHRKPLSSNQSSSSSAYTGPFYEGYYDSLTTWSNGEELKNKLNEISHKTYKALNYTSPNYETNINADRSYHDYEFLDVIYSDTDVSIKDTNKGWQREHAFCASLMCGSITADAVKRVGRATDFHNLFAANSSANSSRGNKNYGNADKTNEYYQNRTTQNGLDGYSFDPTNFEPADKDKGRVARAIFYMAMMYKDDEKDEINNITMKGLRIVEEPVTYVQGEEGAFAIGNLSTLLDWNKKYPVDYLEMQHNISVYKDKNSIDGFAQGNRNPFVDYPVLADYVYGVNKDKQGNLSECPASEAALECYASNNEISHYALKEAKRSYEPGSTLQDTDYKVVKVLKNYKYEEATEGVINSLSGHTFALSDGETVDAYIGAGKDTFKYKISVNASGATSSGEIVLSTTGIDKNKPNQDQEVTYGNVPFILNIGNTTHIQNISAGGITLGSGNNVLSSLTIKTKNSYTVNAAYIKALAGNKSSSYSLTIKVGDSVVFTGNVNSTDEKQFGTQTSSSYTGQISYIFTGSTSLKINSIAFNEII